MTDDQIEYSIAKLKEYGIVNSGDALTKGIGAMTDEHMKDFFDKMVKAGLVKADLDYKKGYTLQFVNKGVGLDQKPKCMALAEKSARRPCGRRGRRDRH